MFLCFENPKKSYYENFRGKNIIDEKLFWKTIKPSFSDKLGARDKIHLTEKDEIIKTEIETAETLNRVFANVINNPLIDSIEKCTIKVPLKYRNHPSILAFHERKKNR